jgi:predicted RNA binding protein YcfA (HicA-like mRNA interferase family)
MSKVPRITAREAIEAFRKAGFETVRIESHHIMKKAGVRGVLSIPVHGNKTLGVGLLSAQIKVAGLTVDQFTALL